MSSLFFSHDLFNFMSFVFEGWFIQSFLQHHLFYIWNVNGNWGVFCEMSTKRNPGSPQGDKKRPLILKWDWMAQIRVGMVCFALAPDTYGDTWTRVGVTLLLIRAAIHQHSFSLWCDFQHVVPQGELVWRTLTSGCLLPLGKSVFAYYRPQCFKDANCQCAKFH